MDDCGDAGNDVYYPDERRWRWWVLAAEHLVCSAFAWHLIDTLLVTSQVEWVVGHLPALPASA